MQLQRLTFDQNGLESLNSKSVQRGSTVKHDRMLLDDILEDIKNFRPQLLHHLLGVLNVVCFVAADQFFHNKGLEQLYRHLFGKSALVDLKLRTDDYNGTSGIIDSLAKQVLAKTSLLAL